MKNALAGLVWVAVGTLTLATIGCTPTTAIGKDQINAAFPPGPKDGLKELKAEGKLDQFQRNQERDAAFETRGSESQSK